MLATLLASLASGEAFLAVKRIRTAIAIYAVGFLLSFTGIGFLIGAGFVATRIRYGSFWACIYFGAGFLLLALVIIVAYRATAAMRARTVRQRRATEAKTVIGAAAMAAIPALLASKRGPSLLLGSAAVTAAYAILREWNRPGRRDSRLDRRG